MVTTPVLFDTCILIDFLKGIPQARVECNRYADRAISVVTWIEILAGATPVNEDSARALLLNFRLMRLTSFIAERAVVVRRVRKIKLPDAIIQATAEAGGRILITRNTRDFPAKGQGIRVPYTL
jgi:predicted nucleic acid-binding protein